MQLAALGIPYFLRAGPLQDAANGDQYGPRKKTRLATQDGGDPAAFRPAGAGGTEQPPMPALPHPMPQEGSDGAGLALPHAAPLDVPSLVVEHHNNGQLFTGMLAETGHFQPSAGADGAFVAQGDMQYAQEAGDGTEAGLQHKHKGSGTAVAQQTCPECGLKQPARRNTCAAEGCFYNFKAARWVLFNLASAGALMCLHLRHKQAGRRRGRVRCPLWLTRAP